MPNVEINLMSTLKGSLLEGFFPAGWDLERIDACCLGEHPKPAIDDHLKTGHM